MLLNADRVQCSGWQLRLDAKQGYIILKNMETHAILVEKFTRSINNIAVYENTLIVINSILL